MCCWLKDTLFHVVTVIVIGTGIETGNGIEKGRESIDYVTEETITEMIIEMTIARRCSLETANYLSDYCLQLSYLLPCCVS